MKEKSTIALVDDERNILTSLRMALEAEGYKVRTYGDGVSALEALTEELIPLADVLTPNLPEAEALLGHPIKTTAQFDAAGAALLTLGAGAVLLKGGHAKGNEVVDRYYDARGVLELRHPRLPLEGHGTGCTLASAIAAGLAGGRSPRSAVRRAVAYVQRALQRGYRPGGGAVHVLRH